MGNRQSNTSNTSVTQQTTTPKPPSSASSSNQDYNPIEGAKIEKLSNLPLEDQAFHNKGQPINQRVDEHGNIRSKFMTACQEEHAASLKCIDDNYENKAFACKSFFDAYKKCKTVEHERRLEENAKKYGGNNDPGCVIC